MTTASGTRAHVLVVDDEPDLRTLYELTLLREGHDVEVASDVAQARQALEARQFDLLITDMRLPDGLGLELLQWLREHQRRECGLVITAYGSAENAVESLKAGAFDYLTKPVDLGQFRRAVASALQAAPHTGNRADATAVAPSRPSVLRDKVLATDALQRLVGDSAAMNWVKDCVRKVAPSMAPILIRGESGTGKELVARAVHACSHRAQGPMVAVNCGAIPETLLEAEFFGARKGAYTGATQDRPGFFQSASGGTLFLDEIGELPLSMQAKLLRAIQERCVRPLGSPQEESTDVRIVSATHRDLRAEVAAGRFRQDLFYRLHVIEVLVPPLRERREDLPALCDALLQRIAREAGTPVPAVSTDFLSQLSLLELPGNVRELENILYRALALSDSSGLCLDLPVPATAPAEYVSTPGVEGRDRVASEGLPTDLQTFLDDTERRILQEVLAACDYNRTAAAARLGLNLRQIRYRISRLGIAIPRTTDEQGDLL